MVLKATLRFYEELNDFLPPDRRKKAYAVCFPARRSVKDLIESQGVPHTEVDLILVNGQSVGFECQIQDGDAVSVYPCFESLDIASVSRLGRAPLRDTRFVADVHLGKLVRYLRLLGFDCLYDKSLDDAALAKVSAGEHRILLTRDRGLLMRAMVTHGMFLHSCNPVCQVQEVMQRLDLAGQVKPLARCLVCNGLLAEAGRQQVRGLVPAYTLAHVEYFLQCADCGKVFWKGTHWPRLERIIAAARTADAGE